MQRFVVVLIVFLALPYVAATLASQSETATNPNNGDSTASVPHPVHDRTNGTLARGEYLVHHVAMCVQCHSPHRVDGTLDEDQLLTGAPIPVESPFQGQQWAFRAPSLRGLPGGWTEEQLVTFLQTGEPPTDYAIRPPMPPFRLKEEDAQAIAAYLRSLEPIQ
jgi:mono/diheme cytochrome c family protein